MYEIASLVLGGFLVVIGVLHFAAPARIQALVPEWWPAPRATVLISGVVELLLGAGLFVPSVRAEAGLAAAVLFVGYVGVHADDLRSARGATTFFDSVTGVAARTLANVGYVAWAAYVGLGG